MTNPIPVLRVMTLAVLLALPLAGRADDPAPFPDFTFKRGKPPPPGTTKRITVQITPEDKPAPTPQPDAPDADQAWFWQAVPAHLAADSARRLRRATEAVRAADAGAVPAPRLQEVQAVARREGAHILRATIGTRVSPALVLAVIAVESGGRAGAQSPKGAQGLMQLMPDTAARFGVADRLAPDQNIRGGVAYLDWLLTEFDGDAVLALAGYNAGEGAVRKHGGVPPYPETRAYVPRVLAAYEVALGLCRSRPELITDGCALRLAVN